jgi:tellurite resistance protein
MAAKKNSRSVSNEERQLFVNNARGMIEAGFLMAAADGNLDESEINALGATLSALFEGAISDEQINEILAAHKEDLERDGFEARMAAMVELFTSDEARHAALQVAAAVMFADGAVDADSELAIYLDLADALGISRAEAKAIGDRILEGAEAE